MNEELTTKFLEGIGTTNEDIALLKDPPDDGVDIETMANKFKQKQREVYANDPDVIKDLEVKATGKARGSVEREIKRVFDISTGEWEENDFGNEKDYKKVLQFGIEKVKKQGNKSVQEIQSELQEANKKIKWYDEERIPEINKEWQSKTDRNDIERHFRKLIGEGGDLIVSGDVASTVIEKRLNEKGFVTELNEDRNEIVIKTRDGLIPQDEAKTRNLSNMEIVKGILSGEKLIKESHAQETPPPQPRFTPEPAPGAKAGELPGMAAARANLEEVKQVERTERLSGKPLK